MTLAAPLEKLLQQSPVSREPFPSLAADQWQEQPADAMRLELERDPHARSRAVLERLDRASRDRDGPPSDTAHCPDLGRFSSVNSSIVSTVRGPVRRDTTALGADGERASPPYGPSRRLLARPPGDATSVLSFSFVCTMASSS
jgi:hypothetical protein